MFLCGLSLHCSLIFWLYEGQLSPAERNTSSEGIRRDFIEKTTQEWGSKGSQLTL